MIRLLLISMVLSLISACSTLVKLDAQEPGDTGTGQPEVQASKPKPYGQIDEASSESSPQPSPQKGAVLALLERADKYSRKGDVGSEAATIERALRITPSDATLWSRLATIRLSQGQPQQAEQLALKSNSLAGTDQQILQKNWQLVARARWMLNDTSGAISAEEKARSEDY